MIQIYKGDTVKIEISLENNGQPFVPTTETVVFSIGDGNPSPIISKNAADNVVILTHEETKALEIGMYSYDVRVYDQDKTLVATPCYGNLKVLGVVNNDL